MTPYYTHNKTQVSRYCISVRYMHKNYFRYWVGCLK